MISEQLSLYTTFTKPPGKDRTSTFQDNLSLPIHRWFRYSAGFSALWVRKIIEREKCVGRQRVLDPFSGTGTVLLEGEYRNLDAMGLEAHPFVARAARAKLSWRENPEVFRKYGLNVLEKARRRHSAVNQYPSLIEKCFTSESLSRLDSLRRKWEEAADGSVISELTWLALMSSLRDCSKVGTAQSQYILPKKTKAKVLDPYEAFERRIYLISSDMAWRQNVDHGPKASLHWEDARKCHSIPDGWADLIITSPPYSNNFDYADVTRLEMTFFGEVRGWADLQETVRKFLIRSCTQHVSRLSGETYRIANDPLLDPIRKELVETCTRLEVEREKHGGKKTYHTMIAAYFLDMARVWHALRRVSSDGVLVCFVIGDSAPYGIYVPVDKWLGQLALSAGFKSYSFEKTRDRNVKWKNRKHRVPLHEGRLWILG